MSEPAGIAAAESPPTPKRTHSVVKTVVGAIVTVVVLVGVFAYAIPQFANYHEIGQALGSLDTKTTILLAAGGILAMTTFWWINMAALPGLRFWPAAVVTQSSYAVANSVPAGGPISLAVTYQILHKYLFRTDDIVLMIGVGGIWNVLGKFITPVIAVGVLLLSGDHSDQIVTAALIGVGVMVAVFTVLGLLLWKESIARAMGDGVGRFVSWFLKRLHKPAVTGWGDHVAEFRRRTLKVVRHRWEILTVTAVVNQLAFFLVLFVSLRGVGVTSAQMDFAEMFAAFAFARLASAVPITPGGIGTTELFFIGLLVTAGGPKPEVVAGVLLFRTVTYLLPIPVGALIYLAWKATFKGGKGDPTAAPAPG